MKKSLSEANKLIVRNLKSRWRSFVGIVALALLCGCSGYELPSYPVLGHVLYADEKPLPGGVLVLEPLEGQAKANPKGTIGPDGSFTITTPPNRTGAEAGKYRVMIQAFDPAYDDQKAPRSQAPPQLIHPRYQTFETSGLEVTIEPKDNDITLHVDRPR